LPTAPDIVFLSDFPLGFHNREPEEKMARFAARGYRVHYVEKLGIRNPGVRDLGRVARRLWRGSPGARELPFETLSPKLVPPRRVPAVAALNRRWIARQLLPLADPERSIWWFRYPVPEVVDLLDHGVRPRLVVYEVVDDHESSPGMDDGLRRVYRAAEDRLLQDADVVFAWSEPIRGRLAQLHPRVELAPAAADLERFARVGAVDPPERVAAYTGSIDFRLDGELVAETARLLPDWRFVLAGPVLDRSALELAAGLPNVELPGAVAPDEVPTTIANASVCLMPYRVNGFTDVLVPIKLVEYLAAGRPVVSTPIRAAREFGDVVALAASPAEFAGAIVREAAEDAPAKRGRRMGRVAAYGWDARIDSMAAVIEEALADG
jgi:glycosyltransferase involved in cell wall biosynthesis